MHEQTLAIHAGYEKDSMGTMAVPIYQTTAYEFRDTEHAANLFALKEFGKYIYKTIFNVDEVYPHILLRDYAKNTIEYMYYDFEQRVYKYTYEIAEMLFKEVIDNDISFATWDIYHLMLGGAFNLLNVEITLGLGYAFGSENMKKKIIVPASAAYTSPASFEGLKFSYQTYKLVIGFAF